MSDHREDAGDNPTGSERAGSTRPTTETESWFDSLSARPRSTPPVETPERQAPEPEPLDRGAVFSGPPSGVRAGDAATIPGASVVTGRRVKDAPTRTKLSYVDPLSVLKVSLIVYSVLLILWLLLVAFVFTFLEGLGLFQNINSALRGFAYDEVEITLGLVERWALVVGLVVLVTGSVLNVFISLIYNLLARFLGGVEVTLTESDR